MFGKLKQLLSNINITDKNNITEMTKEDIKNIQQKIGISNDKRISKMLRNINNKLKGYDKKQIEFEKEIFRQKVMNNLFQQSKDFFLPVEKIFEKDIGVQNKINYIIDEFVNKITNNYQKPENITNLIVEKNINSKNKQLYNSLAKTIVNEISVYIYKNLMFFLPFLSSQEKTGNIIINHNIIREEKGEKQEISYDFKKQSFIITTYKVEQNNKYDYHLQKIKEDYARSWPEVKEKVYPNNIDNIEYYDLEWLLSELNKYPRIIKNFLDSSDIKPSIKLLINEMFNNGKQLHKKKHIEETVSIKYDTIFPLFINEKTTNTKKTRKIGQNDNTLSISTNDENDWVLEF